MDILDSKIGNMSGMATSQKSSIAGAINEVEDMVLVQEVQPIQTGNKLWVSPPSSSTQAIQVPTWTEYENLRDTKVNVSDVKDNLTSTDTNKPLSANQGKVLGDKLDYFYTGDHYSKAYENINADTLTKTGFYYMRNCSNLPDGAEVYGYMIVQRHNSNPAYCKQFYSPATHNETYYRICDNGDWSGWVKIPQVIDRLTSGSTVDALSANQGKQLSNRIDYFISSVGKSKAYADDLDVLITNGFYYVNGSAHRPTAINGMCIVIAHNKNDADVKQLYSPWNENAWYVRTKPSADWTEWVRLTTNATDSVTLTNVTSNITIASNLTGVYRNGKYITGTVYFTPTASIPRATVLFKLPRPLNPYNIFTIFDNKNETQNGGLWLTSNGNATYFGPTSLSANTPYIATFSYLEE